LSQYSITVDKINNNKQETKMDITNCTNFTNTTIEITNKQFNTLNMTDEEIAEYIKENNKLFLAITIIYFGTGIWIWSMLHKHLKYLNELTTVFTMYGIGDGICKIIYSNVFENSLSDNNESAMYTLISSFISSLDMSITFYFKYVIWYVILEKIGIYIYKKYYIKNTIETFTNDETKTLLRRSSRLAAKKDVKIE
jgi:hypothetical protein